MVLKMDLVNLLLKKLSNLSSFIRNVNKLKKKFRRIAYLKLFVLELSKEKFGVCNQIIQILENQNVSQSMEMEL